MKPLKNAHLKKRAMAALISSTLIAGTAVSVAPDALALTYTGSSAQIVGAYQSLSEQELRQFYSDGYKDLRNQPFDVNTFVLPNEVASGWCIDWGIDNPWNNEIGGYEVRKLTGASGRFGDGLGINDDVRLAAINVTKSLIKDYEQYQKNPSSNLVYQIQTKNRILQALLSNNLGSLNEIRGYFHENRLNKYLFSSLTGFDIIWKRQDVQGDGTPNYVLVKNANFQTVKENYTEGEYVTVLVPKNYNLNLNPKKHWTFQRIITIVQPGLPGPKPPPQKETIEETTTIPQDPSTVTTTETLPAHKTTTMVTESPRTVTATYTHPEVTVTERKELPTAYTTVRTTRPRQTVTETVKATPVVTTTTEVVGGETVTKTVTETPAPKTVTSTVEGEPTTVTETISDTPVVVTKPATTVTATHWSTPTRTTVVDVPGTTVTTTKTETPKPVTTTNTVTLTENYYTEKVYESVKEIHEYYYFAGFTKKDKSKEIELPGGIKGSWTFEVTKGRDIVIVERTEDGKLIITPKPGFEGEGDVEILITDERGNQYIYRVKVSDTITVKTQTNVTVNNFFYTLNPNGENRVKIIPLNPGDKIKNRVYIDENGVEHKVVPGSIKVDPDEQGVKVEVTDTNLRGQVVVTTVDESGNERENIVTIENTTSKFEVVREILSTSTAIVERRGGTFKIVEGNDLVDITEGDNDTWVITPKDKDREGKVVVVFTDKNGVEYKYTIDIKKDVNSGPVIRNYEIQSNGSVNIERRSEWDIKVISGDVEVTEGRGKLGGEGADQDIWTVKPRNGFTGEAIIHIIDKKTGTLIGVWNIQVNPAQDVDGFDFKENEPRNIVDRAVVDLTLGYNEVNSDGRVSNRFTFDVDQKFDSFDKMLEHYKKEYDGIIDFEKSKIAEDGDWKLVFKPGAKGQVQVLETALNFKDDANGKYEKITKFTYNVTPAPVRNLEYDVTSDNVLELEGTNLRVVDDNKDEAKKLVVDENSLPTGDTKSVKIEFNRNADGKIVLENLTDEGFVFERYTINVTPGRDAEVKPLEREMAWNATARIPGAKDDEAVITEGKDLVKIERDEKNDQFIITGMPDKTGLVKIQVKDARGVWAEYHLNMVAPKSGESTYTVSTNSEFRATLVNGKNSFLLVEGGEFFQEPKTTDGEWILKPKADAAGKSGVVEERDSNGSVLNRYTVNVVQGRVSTNRQQRSVIPVTGYTDIPPMKNGGKFFITSGSEYVTTSTVDGNFRVTAKPDTVGQVIRVEERDGKGTVLRTILLDIVPVDTAESGTLVSNGKSTGTNKDLPEIKYTNNPTTGTITITLPDGVKSFVPVENGGKVKSVKEKDGKVVVETDQGAPGDSLKYVLVDKNGNQSYVRTLKLNVKVTGETGNQTTKGSSELDGTCIAGIVGMTAPLLLAIPLGILSQVQIPGLEQVSAQVNAAIRQANDQIQRGLGIHNDDRARRAAGIQGAFAIENPQMIGLAAGALGAITLGLLAVDGVMRACGAGEYTSSYMVGKATGNETLMKGSSDKMPESKDKGTEENKPAEDK